MAVGKFISIASLLGALSLVGCGGSARNVCDACQVQDLRSECEEFYNLCDGPDCEELALTQCGIL